MSAILFILKKIGRIWTIVTREHELIPVDSVVGVLLVQLRHDKHLADAIEAVRRRFPHAQLTVMTSRPDEVVSADPKVEVVPLRGKGGRLRVVRTLWSLHDAEFSAVIVMSLDPIVLVVVLGLFSCYKLLYNRWQHWFLVRRRSTAEMLSRRVGDDVTADVDADLEAHRVARSQHHVNLVRMLFAYPGRVAMLVGTTVYVGAVSARLLLRRAHYLLSRASEKS